MAEKRSITAREAKDNLEAFGYDGPARWSSIDAFVKANPRAKAAVTANKGALVQSEALGFAQGGAVEPSEEAIKKLADVTYMAYKTGVGIDDQIKALEDVGIDRAYNIHSTSGLPDNYFSDRGIDTSSWEVIGTNPHTGKAILKNPNYNLNAVNDLLSANGYTNSGDPSEFYGQNTPSDPVAKAFDDHTKKFGQPSINNFTANTIFAEEFMNKEGINTQDTFSRTSADIGKTLDQLKQEYNTSKTYTKNLYATQGYDPSQGTGTANDILGQSYMGGVSGGPTFPEIEALKSKADPLPTTIPIEPNQQEVEQAQQVFSPDGKVTLPTGYDQPEQKMVMPQPFQPTSPVSGVTTAQSQTFGNNQGQQFAKRATDQAQLIRSQTLAEKTAAGIAPTIQQRLYKNPQGMSTYVTGTVNADGTFVPTTPIPQGYTQAQQMQTGGVATQNFMIPKNIAANVSAEAAKKEEIDMGSQPVIGKPFYPITPEDMGYPSQISQPPIEMSPGYGGSGTPPTITQPVTNTTFDINNLTEDQKSALGIGYAPDGTPYGNLPQGFTPPTVSTDTENPTVNVGGQQLTKEQVAQGQADLTASAVLNPAGTVAATPVANINPDASGTVLEATTGQAAGVAPIVTDPAQVATTATADTPDAVTATTADLQKAQTGVQGVLDDTTAQTSTGPTKTITGQTQDTTKVSGLDAAQIGKAQTVQGMPTRTLQAGEKISGSAVDQTKVGEAFGTGEVQAATVKDELTTLMQDFEGGDTPAWAAGAMRNATAQMQARGLGASSMAGQALIQSAMESALPIAMADASNKQQMAMLKAEQRAKFLGMEFDQNFQAKVMNAAKVSEIANMNFSAEQQVALENAKMAQTVDLANLNNQQALVMAEAAQISQLEMASLSNLQQAQVQNAQNFLQIDMANLNNQQQTEIFKAQTLANTILSDTAAANANEQFNASNQTQVDQFNNTMKSQLNQFNSAQINAMNQFNAGEANAIQKFNSELQNQREIFNSQMYAQIAQANAKWRQDVETTNTAMANQSNFQYAKDVNGLTNKAIDQIWQRERDLMSFAFTASESAMERTTRLLLGDKTLEGVRLQADAQEGVAKTSFFARLLFGSGGLNIFGDKGLIGGGS